MSGTVADGVRRAGLLRTLMTWHWISSAICLAGMILFAITGITLNHAAQIEAHPVVERKAAQVPPAVTAELRASATALDGKRAPLGTAAAAWAEGAFDVDTGGRDAEWSADEVYLPLARPGGDAWIRIGLEDGAAEFEDTDRGPVSLLNDLHKGRNAGTAWAWFIDIFAVACLVFCLTGLIILAMHAKNRPITWPLAGLGVVVPVVLALLFIH